MPDSSVVVLSSGPTTLSPAIASRERRVNPALLYLASLYSPESRRTMRSKINCVARLAGATSLEDMDWTTLRFQTVYQIMLALEAKKLVGSTINCYLVAIKGIAHMAWAQGLLPESEWLRIQDVKSRRYSRKPTGRSISSAESRSLLNVEPSCSRTKDVRDYAILTLMIGCGIRRAEICGLRLEDLNREEKTLEIVGKGNKGRTAHLPPETLKAVGRWIDEFRGTEAGYLFGRVSKSGKLTLGRPLNPSGISQMIERNVGAKGIAKLTPHDLRRTFATRLLAAGHDIVTVQRAMGHANVQTTARYDRRGEEAQKKMAETVLL